MNTICIFALGPIGNVAAAPAASGITLIRKSRIASDIKHWNSRSYRNACSFGLI